MSDTNSDDQHREHGIDFGVFGERLESMNYPVERETLVTQWGDHELDLPKGSERVADALEPLGEERFESADAVREAILTMVDSEAVGREGYSDRGDTAEQEENDQQQSF